MKIRFMVDYPHDKLQIVTVELPNTVLDLQQTKFDSFVLATKLELQRLFDPQGGYVQTEVEWTYENCNDEYCDGGYDDDDNLCEED